MYIKVEVVKTSYTKRGYQIIYSGFSMDEGKRIYNETLSNATEDDYITLVKAYYLEEGVLNTISVLLPNPEPIVRMLSDW